jgi:acetate kinase
VNILVANIGSTSFKYRLYGEDQSKVLAQGRIERIGQPGGDCPDYATAITRCGREVDFSKLSAIGFKAVLAGPISGARIIDDRVLDAMEEYAFFAPAHNPPYIAAMRSFRQALPQVPLVALFETAFFDQMPDGATTYGVPYAWREELGVRRYGFHGASHRAASERAQEVLGRRDIRHISCHLGGSSSLAAMRNGVAIESSFGMSPQSGLPHNNRTGDLDVFAALYVMKKRSLSVDQMVQTLAAESGLAGISGTSGDIRDITDAIAAGDARAKLALDVFVHSIRHHLGACLLELGGLDVLTFSGGIGENSPEIRAGVCRGLEEFGIVLDEGINAKARGETAISAFGARVRILIVPADEERIVARATAEVIARGAHV